MSTDTRNILNMGMFDNSASGKMMRTVMLAFAEFERDMIVQRTAEGREMSKAKNPDYKEGRKRKEPADFEKFLKMQKDGLITVDEAIKELNISRSTWYARCREAT